MFKMKNQCFPTIHQQDGLYVVSNLISINESLCLLQKNEIFEMKLIFPVIVISVQLDSSSFPFKSSEIGVAQLKVSNKGCFINEIAEF